MKNKKAYLVLADGTVFNGISMGKEGTALGEVVSIRVRLLTENCFQTRHITVR